MTGENLHLSQHFKRSRQLDAAHPRDCCALGMHKAHPILGWKLECSSMPLFQLQTLPASQIRLGNQASLYCNAASGTSAVPSSCKVDFLNLQNGSDIRGVAVDGVEGEPVSLTVPVSESIGAAFAAWLLDKKKPSESRRLRVSIGHDSRISAQTLQDAISRGLGFVGLEVVQYGLSSTPAMFYSTITDNEDFLCPVDGSIMVTASHLPYNRNGFKFFTNTGGLGKADIKDILERAADIYVKFLHQLMVSDRDILLPIKQVDYMTVYTSDLINAVRKAAGNKEKPLDGLHIVVDAGNGAGGFFAGDVFTTEKEKTMVTTDDALGDPRAEDMTYQLPSLGLWKGHMFPREITARVLEPLGAVTTGSQFLDPNGLFPNHIPNPEDKMAMRAIIQAVLDNKADMGIIFDTDVDRSAAVDSNGHEFNRNRLIALISAIVLEEHPGTTIVTDSVTSDGLTTFIENKLGGKHHRFKRGYKNVIDEAIRLNSVGEETHLAIETSGHGALKENHWLDDGAYLMVKILNKLASAGVLGFGRGSKVLSDLIAGLEESPVAVELRLKIDQNHADLKGGSFREYGEAVLKHLENRITSDPSLQKATKNYEGVRVSGYGGWFLLRLSLHDPVLPLNIEAQTHDDAVKLGIAVLAAVNEFPALDASALNTFVQKA